MPKRLRELTSSLCFFSLFDRSGDLASLLAGPEPFPENSLQHLARRVLGQVRVGKVDSTRNLIVRQELLAVCHQFVRGELRPRFQYYAGRHQFSPPSIWNAVNCYFPDGGVIEND